MQKLNNIVSEKAPAQFQTIFFQWSEVKKISKRPEKKLLRHYLSTIEQITQEGFFQRRPHRISPSEFTSINKNAFQGLHQAYEETNSLIVETGARNQKLYSFPSTYPMQMKDWLTVEGGYLKIDRGELTSLLENLSDNELRVYFIFKRIFEASGCPDMGVETWYKVIRSSHLNISQGTLKKCISALIDKNYISVAEPILEESREKHRFIFSVKKISLNPVSNKLSASFQKNEGVDDQFPENFAHINKSEEFKSDINLNQKPCDALEIRNDQAVKSDFFNFYGLDEIPRPLEIPTIFQIKRESGLSMEQIQESVWRFSRYYFSHAEIMGAIENPVGLLRTHLKNFKQVYVEPEWWLEVQHRVDLGEGRFSSDQRNPGQSSGRFKKFVPVDGEGKRKTQIKTTATASMVNLNPKEIVGGPVASNLKISNCLRSLMDCLGDIV